MPRTRHCEFFPWVQFLRSPISLLAVVLPQRPKFGNSGTLLKDFPTELIYEVGECMLPPPFTQDIRDALLSGSDIGLVLQHYSLFLTSLASLSSLSLVNRSIRACTEPLLYKRLIISLSEYASCAPFRQTKTDTAFPMIPKVRLLLRTLGSRPDLAEKVEAVLVDSEYLVFQARAMANLNKFLSICPRVQMLVLKTDYLDNLDPRSVPNLKVLATSNCASEAIDEICSRFPLLTTFEIYCYLITFPPTRPAPTTLPPLKAVCVSLDPVVFQNISEDMFLWVMQRFGNRAEDLYFRYSASRMVTIPTPLPLFNFAPGQIYGAAVRNLELRYSRFTLNNPHTHDILRHLPQLEHLHISFCQSFNEADILERLPFSLRYLTFTLFGQKTAPFMHNFAMKIKTCSNVDEDGFVQSLIGCLSETFTVGCRPVPQISGIAVLKGSVCRCHPTTPTTNLRPLEEFCRAHGEVTFHEKLQSTFPDPFEVGRGVIQIICQFLSFFFQLHMLTIHFIPCSCS